MTLKEEGYSEWKIYVKLGCSKQVVLTAVNCFTKFRTYGDRREKRHPRETSTVDESIMKLTVKKSPTNSNKKS